MIRSRLRLLFLLLVVLTNGAVARHAVGAEAPNIVLVYVDDLGAVDLGCYGSQYHRTPHIDRLAEQGTRFTQAYAACTVCSPSRVSLLTGQYPARTRVTDWIPGHAAKFKFEKLRQPAGWRQGLRESWVTLPEVLKTAGYATAWFGKWHAGGEPQQHGFDQAYHDWKHNRVADNEDPKGVFALTDQTIAFLQSHPQQPVFVGLSHFAVHTPVFFNQETKQRYQQWKMPGQKQSHAGYAAMLDAVDESFGRLMEYLDGAGKSENTLVVFYSDNGGLDHGPDKGPAENAPLRNGKGWQYEGGLRVPLIMRWPGHVPAAVTTDARMTTPDLLPTFASVAGISQENLPPVLDGVDLWPHVTQGKPLAERPLYWHYPHYHQGFPGSVILQGDYKLIHRPQENSDELYNLRSDPSEEHNLATAQPAKASELRRKLDAWLQAVDAQRMTPNPKFNAERAKRAG